MKKKILLTIGITFSVLLVLVSSASAAIVFYQTDGVWGRVDDGYDGIVFDVVGKIGDDFQGTAWTASGGRTTAGALIRNAAVCTHDIDGDASLSDWTFSTPGNPGNLGLHTFVPTCNYQGLFISEYRQGGTDAIEIFNNMGEDIDLAGKKFSIQIYNGTEEYRWQGGWVQWSTVSSTPSVNIPLTGTIANGATYVIASQTITGVTNQISSILQFDGNDAVALVRDYVADPTGDSDDGATGLMYGTGPTGNNPTDTPITTGTNPSVQTGPITDFNQIRYGSGNFSSKSGLAFKGVDNHGSEYQDGNAFLAGKFCHVNNPISNPSNSFLQTYLTLDLMNMTCGTGAVAPFPPPRLTFVYPVALDETPNEGTCAYPPPATGNCADAVTFTSTTSSFTCFYQGEVTKTYYVKLLGFMPTTPDGDCTTVSYNAPEASGIFVSQEGSTNCGCLFAMVTESSTTAVNLISFSAAETAEGALVQWETASETDNLGFNLYRAASEDGERVLLNSSLIPTKMPPGSPIGGLYEYLDTTTVIGQTYFYWLEDIDLAGVATLNGPVTTAR